ncbi:hypothetical protein HU830_03385 [Lactobacillus sp. DCY120]|uniref:Uncharacterized protein n=1 Tax=Bombilactobacillus apium TaxID=2675299 RepID=A0A850R1I7_9LACO|nr:hypothetical protein [Bombilactobacillus apium]NVY96220.1 hypothetical protein [Bombilactobacillus apium]
MFIWDINLIPKGIDGVTFLKEDDTERLKLTVTEGSGQTFEKDLVGPTLVEDMFLIALLGLAIELIRKNQK